MRGGFVIVVVVVVVVGGVVVVVVVVIFEDVASVFPDDHNVVIFSLTTVAIVDVIFTLFHLVFSHIVYAIVDALLVSLMDVVFLPPLIKKSIVFPAMERRRRRGRSG